jgi:Ca-activated chloride channel homolog
MFKTEFAQPYFLLLLLLLPLWAFWLHRQRKTFFANFRFSTAQGFISTPKTFKTQYRWLPQLMRFLCLTCIIVALARPQLPMQSADVTSQGIDIVLCLDESGSMMARDFQPDRFGASKKVAAEFIKMRPNDRIGLVSFAGESYTRCPLTTDHVVLTDLLMTTEMGLLSSGTAIGMGLANSARCLKNSKATSKVIILLTDGVNEGGYIQPTEAVETIKKLGFRVYTIGVGTNGLAEFPTDAIDARGERIFQPMQVVIDEQLLKFIAEQCNGQYFRAVDEQGLQEIYAEIDKLERSKILSTSVKLYEEHFAPWLFCALFLLAVELVLKVTLFKSVLD